MADLRTRCITKDDVGEVLVVNGKHALVAIINDASGKDIKLVRRAQFPNAIEGMG